MNSMTTLWSLGCATALVVMVAGCDPQAPIDPRGGDGGVCGEAGAGLPDWLKGSVSCGDKTCGPGQVCETDTLQECFVGGSADGGTCPQGCVAEGRHGCRRAVYTCLTVPSVCYNDCKDPSCKLSCIDDWCDSHSRNAGSWPY